MAYALGDLNVARTYFNAPGLVFGTSGRALITGKAPAKQTITYQRPGAKLPVYAPIPTSVFRRPITKAPVLKLPSTTLPSSATSPLPSFSSASTSTVGGSGGGGFPVGGETGGDGETSATDALASFTKSPLLLIGVGLAALLLLNRKG